MSARLIIIYILINFCISSANATTPLSKLNEQQVISLLCNKWQLISIESKGKKLDVVSYDTHIIFNFLSNGQLEASVEKTIYNGSWVYNHSKHIVTTTNVKENEEQVILEISNEKLRMKTKYLGVPVIFEMTKIN